jgi:hypothetical protein
MLLTMYKARRPACSAIPPGNVARVQHSIALLADSALRTTLSSATCTESLTASIPPGSRQDELPMKSLSARESAGEHPYQPRRGSLNYCLTLLFMPATQLRTIWYIRRKCVGRS